MTLPVSFDTTGLDAQMKAAKDSLAKLGPAGVSLSLDTISFDQSLLRAKSALDGIQSKTIDLKITTTGSATIPSNSSISVHVVGDTKDATDAIQAVIDKEIPSKTVHIYGDITDAQSAMDDIDADSVKAKTLVIQGAHKAALGAEVGSGGKTFAMDAIAEVNTAFIPLKTAVIAGDNTHAKSAIANVKTALDGIKDKTVYITVVKKEDSGGGSGNDDGNGKDNRIPGNALRNNSSRPIVYLAQNLYVRNDLDLAAIKGVVDTRLAEVFNQ
jgi:hypothetical protein